MHTKSKQNQNNFPVPHAFDLFGEVPVTTGEVIQWVENIARLPSTSPRFDWYVKNWAVAEKIKSVKIKFGTLDDYFMASAANDRRY